MKKAKKRLTNFDFSGEGAHMALVDEPANGVHTLLIKSLDINNLSEEQKESLKDVVKSINGFSEEESQEYVEKLLAENAKGDSPLGQNENGSKEPIENPEEVNKQMSEQTDVQELISKALNDAKAQWEADKAKEITKANEKLSELEKSLNAYKEAEEAAKHAEFVEKAKELESLGVEGEAVEAVAKALREASENENTKALVELVEKANTLIKSAGDLQPIGSDVQPEENIAEESGVMAAIKAKKAKNS